MAETQRPLDERLPAMLDAMAKASFKDEPTPATPVLWGAIHDAMVELRDERDKAKSGLRKAEATLTAMARELGEQDSLLDSCEATCLQVKRHFVGDVTSTRKLSIERVNATLRIVGKRNKRRRKRG